ncbi:hypothetical protein [Rhizobium sp.]|jgi:hypothetical protein|uniref:hypothetical protein n=1 Tax=Rhizobium sp. TaxID=391 RepID=UPI000E819993|nr:hypothetical protein [Rhizobium sp.]
MFLLSGFLGAFLGASLTFFFNMWKFHRDERSSRCDELCKAVAEASQRAHDYWAKTFEASDDQKLVEAELYAAQIIVDGIFSGFRPFLSIDDEKVIDELFSDLMDLLTGGNYSVPGRAKDLTRATNVKPVSADIIVQLRRAHRDTMPFHRISLAFHQNKRRTLDMPHGWK